MACAVETVPSWVLVRVRVYSPETREGETNTDWLFDSFSGFDMIWIHVPPATGTAAPVNKSTQLVRSWIVSVVAVLIVHRTSVLTAAVAFDDGSPFWASAEPATARDTGNVS